MHLDVIDLRHFYYRTRLGRNVQRLLREQVQSLWPDLQGNAIVGFGFAVPLLRPFLDASNRVIGVMPAEQGVMHWPAGEPNLSVLCRESYWPLAGGSADKIICLHGLETSEHPSAVLAEIRRVLAPGGKVLFIVPNRSGLWARRDGTPFGYGRPYSFGQLLGQLQAAGFSVERHSAALFFPPAERQFWLKASNAVEKLGATLSRNRGGGVIILEAVIEEPIRPNAGLVERVRQPLKVLDGWSAGPVRPGAASSFAVVSKHQPDRTPSRLGQE